LILAVKPALVLEQRETAKVAFGAVTETIGSMTKTAVIFLSAYRSFFRGIAEEQDILTATS